MFEIQRPPARVLVIAKVPAEENEVCECGITVPHRLDEHIQQLRAKREALLRHQIEEKRLVWVVG
jgi:hypothetical protein